MTNLKLVLKVYTAYRQMSPDDITLLETLRALNDGDRELMVETLQGKATGKKAAIKTRTYQRCEQCDKTKGHTFHKDSSNDGYHVFQAPPSLSKSSQSQSPSKSPRASGMAAQLKERRQEQQETMKGNNDLCQYEYDNSGVPCCFPADANVHHLTSDPNYHPFVSTAPPAPVPSPANGEGTSSTQNSEASAASAGAATGGSSE